MHGLVQLCVRNGVTPNFITMSSISVMVVAWWLMTMKYYEGAVVLLLLVQLSDLLDGRVAQAMESEKPGSGITPLGEVLDPFRDKALFIGTLLLMPWVPRYVLVIGIGLEVMLILARLMQFVWFRLQRIDRVALPSNGYGKIKMVCENVMIIAYLLQECRPKVLPVVALGLALVFGAMSFVSHVARALKAKPSTS